MKSFAKRFLALASAAAITLTVIPAVHGANNEVLVPEKIVNDWASLEAPAVEEMIPTLVRSASVAAPLTRQGMCGMIMNTYNSLNEQDLKDLGIPAQVFTDTEDVNVIHACQLGLVTARSAGVFAPEETVTRQEFYTAAVQLLGTLGYAHVDEISMDLDVYDDADEITDDAKQAVQVLLCIGAIEQDGLLEPNLQITAEEAVSLLDNVVTYYEQWLEDPVHPQRHLGEEIAEFALNYVGCRYVRGCQGPRKFDCSGLTSYVYKNFGYSLNRTTRDQWTQLGGTIKRADLLPGDILFFSRNGRSSGIFHVGIYIGDGEFVHAANPRKGVIVSGLDEEWYANRYLGAKRVID